MEKIRLGLVIARDEKDLTELKKFITDPWPQVLLFPEYYLASEMIPDACELAEVNKKWLITGVEDRRETNKFYQAAVVINPKGKIVGEHRKTSITKNEIKRGNCRGDNIRTIKTDFGKIGIAICYELHLPEIVRTLALQGAEVIFNPIGTGMWHEEQFRQWNCLASTRAYENGVFVVGCSHYNDTIPIAFAYDPKGKCLLQERQANRLIPITLDPEGYTFGRNFDQRRPELYSSLVKKLVLKKD